MKKSKNRFFSKRAHYFLVSLPPPNVQKGTPTYPIETSDVQDFVGFSALWPSVQHFRESVNQPLIYRKRLANRRLTGRLKALHSWDLNVKVRLIFNIG